MPIRKLDLNLNRAGQRLLLLMFARGNAAISIDTSDGMSQWFYAYMFLQDAAKKGIVRKRRSRKRAYVYELTPRGKRLIKFLKTWPD